MTHGKPYVWIYLLCIFAEYLNVLALRSHTPHAHILPRIIYQRPHTCLVNVPLPFGIGRIRSVFGIHKWSFHIQSGYNAAASFLLGQPNPVYPFRKLLIGQGLIQSRKQRCSSVFKMNLCGLLGIFIEKLHISAVTMNINKARSRILSLCVQYVSPLRNRHLVSGAEIRNSIFLAEHRAVPNHSFLQNDLRITDCKHQSSSTFFAYQVQFPQHVPSSLYSGSNFSSIPYFFATSPYRALQWSQ